MLSEWPDIRASTDADAIHVRRADPAHPLEFRIGRDARGRFVFQLDAQATQPLLARSLPTPAGIEVLRDPIGKEHLRVSLILADSSDFDIFRILCADLLDLTGTLSVSETERGMGLVLDRVARWQDVLARRRAGILKRNEIIGLVGELLFLRDLLLPRMSALAALTAWRGPFGDEQDFAIADTIFEVKTQSSTADRRIQISSEDQLDTAQSRIIVCQQGVAPSHEGDPAGLSLNALVAEIRATIAGAGPAACDRLEVALFDAGWELRSEYDGERWRLVDRTFYEVREGFPRIIRSHLAIGVEEVRYRIRVADCAEFRVDVEHTLEGLLG